MLKSTRERFNTESAREEIVLKYSFEHYPELKKFISGYREDHTALHDYAASLNPDSGDREEIKIEIQITDFGNEKSGYKRYGDVRLDLISAFEVDCEECRKEFHLKGKIWKTIQSKEELEKFERLCRINKWGKLINCDAHLFYFAVLNSENDCFLMKIYDNEKLKSNSDYFINKYGIKINHKSDESWGSAFIPVSNNDEILTLCELNSPESFKKFFGKISG